MGLFLISDGAESSKRQTCKYSKKLANIIGNPQIKHKTRKKIQIPAIKTKIPQINQPEPAAPSIQAPQSAAPTAFPRIHPPDFQKISING
jgi:hypothetical protein